MNVAYGKKNAYCRFSMVTKTQLKPNDCLSKPQNVRTYTKKKILLAIEELVKQPKDRYVKHLYLLTYSMVQSPS